MLSAVYNDPSLLQHIFYRVYSTCLECMESGQILTIVTEQEDQNTIIAFRFSPRESLKDCGEFLSDAVQAAVKKIHGTLTISDYEKKSVEIRLMVSSLPVE